MGKFNPETRVEMGREYDFKGTDGNRALGTLVGGLGDLIDRGTKAVTNVIGHNIVMEAQAGEAQIQDNLFATGKVAEAQASTTKGGQAMPEALTRGMNEALRLKQAYSKGAIRESDYLANLDVLAKKMRSKYGTQWGPEIDNAIGSAMQNTANKFRRQLWSEWDAGQQASDDDAKNKRSFVQRYPEHFTKNPDMFSNPQNYSMAELYSVVGPREARKVQTQMLNSEADLTNKGTQQHKDAQRAALNSRTSLMLDTFADKVSGLPYTKVLYDKIQTMGADGTFDMKEKEALNAWLTAAKQQLDLKWEEMTTESTFLDMDPKDKEAARGMIENQFTRWKEYIHDDDIGAMGYDLRRFQNASNDAFLQWIGNDPELGNAAVAYSALKERGLGDLVKEEFAYIMKGSLDKAAEGGFSLFAQGLLNPDKLNEYIEMMYKAPTGASKEAKTAALKAIDYTVKALVDDRTPMETRRRAGAALFNPAYGASRNFLTRYNGTRGADGWSPREKLYYHIVTPGTIQAMESLKTTDNSSWFNFYTWSVDESFDVMMKQEFDTLVQNRDILGLKYNSQTGRFDVPKPNIPEGPTSRGAAVSAVTQTAQYKNAMDAVNRINFWTQRIKPIIEAEGLSVDQELIRIFEARGFNNAIDLLPSEEDVTNEEGKKGKGSTKTE